MATELREAALTSRIINAFYVVYDQLGFGLLESVYSTCLAYELEERKLPFRREAPVEVYYKGRLSGHYRADFLVDDKIILEIKSTRAVDEADRRQLLNYMRCSTIELGMLLHFGPKPSFQRLIFENDRKRGLSVFVNS